MTLGPLAAAEAQRILDRVARRLLQARLNANAIGAAAWTNNGTLDGGADEVTPPLCGKVIPLTSAERDRRCGGRN